jgi:hypothetical protein
METGTQLSNGAQSANPASIRREEDFQQKHLPISKDEIALESVLDWIDPENAKALQDLKSKLLSNHAWQTASPKRDSPLDKARSNDWPIQK